MFVPIRSTFLIPAGLAALLAGAVTCAGESRAQSCFLGYHERIPAKKVICPYSGREMTLSDALGGRAAVLLFVDASSDPEPGLLRAFSKLHARYGDRIPRYKVLVGDLPRGRPGSEKTAPPFPFRGCFHDPAGELTAAVALRALPGMVIVNESGYIERRLAAVRPEDLSSHEEALTRIYRSSALRGTPIRDFKLPAAGTGWPLDLLETARQDYTMFLFLHRGTAAGPEVLRVLEGVRNRHRGQVSLVAIFEEREKLWEIVDYLSSRSLSPDYAAVDPELLQLRRYHFSRLPVLLVAGPDGNIVFTRKGFRPDDAAPLVTGLEQIFGRKVLAPHRLVEAGRLHAHAREWHRMGYPHLALLNLNRVLELRPDLYTVHAFMGDINRELGNRREAARCYSRYLAASPDGYDVAEVKSKIRSLLQD